METRDENTQFIQILLTVYTHKQVHSVSYESRVANTVIFACKCELFHCLTQNPLHSLLPR